MVELSREGTVCFTGHRVIKSGDKEILASRLDKTLNMLVRREFFSFICGGAVGFDTAAALAVIKKREEDKRVRLVLALPCRDQTAKWRRLDDLSTYKAIVAAADEVIYTGEFYEDGCMHQRNRFMVEHSSVCVSYMNARRGGTAYTVGYAEKCGLEIINLASAPEQLSIFI